MRIEPPANQPRTVEADHKFANAAQNRTRRLWHAKYFILSWFGTGDQRARTNKAKTHVLSALAKAGIPETLNTTRGLTPGLINPANGPHSERIPQPSLRPNAGQPRPRLSGGSAKTNGRITKYRNARKRKYEDTESEEDQYEDTESEEDQYEDDEDEDDTDADADIDASSQADDYHQQSESESTHYIESNGKEIVVSEVEGTGVDTLEESQDSDDASDATGESVVSIMECSLSSHP